jgi:hypothetical protein
MSGTLGGGLTPARMSRETLEAAKWVKRGSGRREVAAVHARARKLQAQKHVNQTKRGEDAMKQYTTVPITFCVSRMSTAAEQPLFRPRWTLWPRWPLWPLWPPPYTPCASPVASPDTVWRPSFRVGRASGNQVVKLRKSTSKNGVRKWAVKHARDERVAIFRGRHRGPMGYRCHCRARTQECRRRPLCGPRCEKKRVN